MPNWNFLLKEIANTKSEGETSGADIVRRKYLAKLYNLTNRNTIAYYSGWLSKPKIEGVEINDEDKNGFMACIHKLDRDKDSTSFCTRQVATAPPRNPSFSTSIRCSATTFERSCRR